MTRSSFMNPTCRRHRVAGLAVLLGLAALRPAAASGEVALIRHAPPAEAEPGVPLVLEVRSTDTEAMAHLRVHYRPVGQRGWERVAFARLPDGAYVAEIPGEAMRSPGVEYYLAADAGPVRGSRFASQALPHRVHVPRPSVDQRMETTLAAYDGRRSRFTGGLLYVDYGPRTRDGTGPPPASERYFALSADFTYRFLTSLHSLRFGIVRLRGDSITSPSPLTAPTRVGYDYGFAEIALAAGDGFGLTGELQLGANHEGFTLGVGSGLRFGRDPGTHYVIWGEVTPGVGARAGIRLHWDTVPHVPMIAGLEVTSWPDARDGGIRLSYGAEISLGEGLSMQPEVSYQARSARFGRLGGGLRVAYDF